jgi:hypothetical protein
MGDGTLAERDITEVFQELSQRSWTGLLRLERSGFRIGVTVEQGRLVFASSSNIDHRLGPLLLRRDAITRRQMEDAVRALAPGKRFGTILVERGFLEPRELVKGVVDQTRDIILHAFEWDSGEYHLEEGAAPSESITLNISTPQLILEGISRIDAWHRVERGCGDLESRWAVQGEADALLRGLPLTPEQRELLGAIDGHRDLETLCHESPLSDFEVCRTLWAFRVIGLARRLDAAAPLDEDGLEYVMPAEGEDGEP